MIDDVFYASIAIVLGWGALFALAAWKHWLSEFWERLVDVVTLRALRGPNIQKREAMMRRRTIEGGKPLDPMDIFWAEDLAATDEFIRHLERELTPEAQWVIESAADGTQVHAMVTHPCKGCERPSCIGNCKVAPAILTNNEFAAEMQWRQRQDQQTVAGL